MLNPMSSCSKPWMTCLFWDFSVIIRMAFKSNGVLQNPQCCQCYGWNSMYSSKHFEALCSCWLFVLDMAFCFRHGMKEGVARSGLVVEAFKINFPSLFEPLSLMDNVRNIILTHILHTLALKQNQKQKKKYFTVYCKVLILTLMLYL